MKALKDCMTSELVEGSKDLADEPGQEFTRRLSLMKLTSEQIQALYEREQKVITARAMPYEGLWAQRYFLSATSTPGTMPKIEDMTFSEMIAITDDANSGFHRDHHVLEGEAWAALCIAAATTAYTEARYAKAHYDMSLGEFGWSMEQGGAFTRNECLLIERLKWKHHEDPAWTEETSNPDQYRR